VTFSEDSRRKPTAPVVIGIVCLGPVTRLSLIGVAVANAPSGVLQIARYPAEN